MAVTWTKEQQAVIDTRNSNILVSAAAGSGKTAVLVERIITMITDSQKQIDIDSLLIVTFTKAAAAEMKERIIAAINKKLEEEPDNRHLQKQTMLIHIAKITTIHSFCLDIIRDYISELDIDPAFRVADEGELKLMRADVIEELLNDYYKVAETEFIEFVDAYSTGKADYGITDLIMKLYTFSQSYPWPKVWLLEYLKMYEAEANDEVEQIAWLGFLINDIKLQIKELLELAELAVSICDDIDGPYMYKPMLEADRVALLSLTKAQSYDELQKGLKYISFDRLSSKKDESVAIEKREYALALRNRIKDSLKKICEMCENEDIVQIINDFKGNKTAIKLLISLTNDFAERFADKKRASNILDFNDFEHMALKILVSRENEKIVESHIANEISTRFHEILIDEYQDSNLVQETILNAVSKVRFGKSNIFMVGDVKQSIYRFRLARPELFVEKYETYPDYEFKGLDSSIDINDVQTMNLLSVKKEYQKDIKAKSREEEYCEDIKAESHEEEYCENIKAKSHEEEYCENIKAKSYEKDKKNINFRNCKIELRKNFRSRENVLLGINFIFNQIMKKQLGNIEYNDLSALNYGAGFKDMNKNIAVNQNDKCELLLVDLEDTDESISSKKAVDSAEYTKKEAEARLIALRIKELTSEANGHYIWDFALNEYRLCKYKDIVILLRSFSGYSEVFSENLQAEGIPVFVETQTGYFSATEVEVVLSMLKIIDNPRNDIPLAAVLKSPMGELTVEELSVVVANYKISAGKNRGKGLYEAVLNYIEEFIDVEKSKIYLTEGTSIIDTGYNNVSKVENETLFKEKLAIKLQKFINILENFRYMASYMEINKLIYNVITETGYYEYVSVMKGGKVRQANLDMLMQKAVEYERTSYVGLFNFVKYIEKLQKYDTDYGEASVINENDNTVKVMTIHKSKGLEFPIVFVAGIDKQFNKMDANSKILLHADYGIAADYIDLNSRVKAQPLIKKVFRRAITLDNMGEELRVLYVALTRAKEKLILSGTVKGFEEKLLKFQNMAIAGREKLPFTSVSSALSYMDWIFMSIFREDKQNEVKKLFDIRCISIEELLFSEIELAVSDEYDRKKLKKLKDNIDIVKESKEYDLISERLSYKYPFEKSLGIHTTVSVSELKSSGVKTENLTEIEYTMKLNKDFNDEVKRPEFMEDKSNLSGANLGTAYHKVFQLISYKEIYHGKSVDSAIKSIFDKNQISNEYYSAIKAVNISDFIKTPLGQRVFLADVENRLNRERSFIIGINEPNSGEMVMLQGIIDMFFEENGVLILVDYKTDYVKANGENVLIDRYSEQLKHYKNALEQITQMTVAEVYIYSTKLKKEILVNV